MIYMDDRLGFVDEDGFHAEQPSCSPMCRRRRDG